MCFTGGLHEMCTSVCVVDCGQEHGAFNRCVGETVVNFLVDVSMDGGDLFLF